MGELPDGISELIDRLVGAWGSWAPTLTPDASRMAFISDRRGMPELWVADLHSDAAHSDAAHSDAAHSDAALAGALSEPLLIKLSDDPVLSVHWSPDSEWLACAVATGGGVRTQVWVVRPDGRDARLVAGSPSQHAALGPWARIGHRLVVSLASEQRDDPIRCDFVDPATGQLEPLAVGDLVDVLDLSADERYVLLRDGERGAQFCVLVDRELDVNHRMLPYPETGSTDVGKFRPSPPGDSSPLTIYFVTDAGRPRRALIAQGVTAEGLRGSAGVLAGREDGELELLDADSAGRLLILVWNVAGASEVELLDTATGLRRPVPHAPGALVSYCVLSRDGASAVLCCESPSEPKSLWRLDTATLALRQVTESSLAALDWDRPGSVSTGSAPLDVMPLDLHEPTLETFVAHDGLALSGWLYRPAGSVGPGPVMLSLHGGPEGQERPAFSPQHQAMVAAGITVFAPNVRGSSGFGRSFVHADDRYGRFDAIADVESCVRFLCELGVADPARVAITGRSYGGYLTLAGLVRYPELFAAGVDICGMSDLQAFYRDTEPWIAAAAVSKYGHPRNDASLLWALSPLHHADAIRAPLLVVHGELDTNVPIGQAHDIVTELRRLDRPVEYLQLDGEGHEYRRASSRATLVHRMVSFLLAALS